MQRSKNIFLKFLSSLIIFTFLISMPDLSFAQKTKGVITGTIVDSESGYPLIGANAFIKGSTLGSSSDLEGKYRIPAVEPGTYTLVVSYMGYQTKEITEISVQAGVSTTLDISLSYEVLQGQEVVVTAKAVKNTEAALLKDRQKAVAVSDAISSEAISQAGAGNAADAMKQVTGASVVGGKDIFIRGLGDRYTSTQLNGVEMPSTDPYKRSGSIDLIPTNMVDNIVTIKSFTPDKPGNFSGGTVDIKTRDFPDMLDIQFSSSFSFNPNVNFNDNGPILYEGGDIDFLGFDDGSRAIPDKLKNGADIPQKLGGTTNLEDALQAEYYTQLFNNIMEPEAFTPSINQSYSLSIGNQFDIAEKPFGFLASLSYSNGYNSYDNGNANRWFWSDPTSDKLQNIFRLNDTKTTHDVLWGALFKGSYKITPNHVISLNLIRNQNGVSLARQLFGDYSYDYDQDEYRTSVLAYTQRAISSYQLTGEHVFKSINSSKLEWRASIGGTRQEEPDIRFFISSLSPEGVPLMRGIRPPQRYYRDLEENRKEFALDFSIPFTQWAGKQATLKIGGLYAQKNRDYEERVFEFRQSPAYDFHGSANELFSQENMGILDTAYVTIFNKTYTNYEMGLIAREQYIPSGVNSGEQNISAGYAMIELPVMDKLRFIGGLRYETTNMYSETNDPTEDKGELETQDLLPSVNFIYNLKDNMNIRTAYTRTLARPTIREMTPYESFEFWGGEIYKGNSELERTLIDNLDLRWEWFLNPGEILAISTFYKDFQNPIEIVILNENRQTEWQNVEKAKSYGIEIEARKRLDFITEKLINFSVGTNLSIVHSEVGIGDVEWREIKANNPNAERNRPFQGQSPYLYNFSLNYDNIKQGVSSSLYFNTFGERLRAVGLQGTPDVYEQPFHLLNFSISYKIMQQLGVKFAVKNILDSEVKWQQIYRSQEYIYMLHNNGRSFSFGLKYTL